ncbi:hypothetical protein [Variovorax sp. GT1P44]|uniref:hypothetical protein n=1 Tax=Variovorax sp. GT1P44 TaxID=3443742 RepID=UPI003F45B116
MRQAIEQLLGIVEAMVADGDLDGLEIEFLKVWRPSRPRRREYGPAVRLAVPSKPSSPMAM